MSPILITSFKEPYVWPDVVSGQGMIDDIRKLLAEIKDREAAATPGPWECKRSGGFTAATCGPGTGYRIAAPSLNDEEFMRGMFIGPDGKDEGGRNQAFIAAARTDIPRLVQIVEDQIDAIDELEQRLRIERKTSDKLAAKCKALADALAALSGSAK
jgi:hypothetical protein